MIVSWEWLKEYVELDMDLDELTYRLTMSGLNLEGVEKFNHDTGIDLEVTSNRPDCLGHIGVAREIGVLYEKSISIPETEPKTIPAKTSSVTSVKIECEDLCPVYIARVIQGVKIGPSPEWLLDRLKTLGIASVNNVVDITNYVLMECGQPLHTFDFDKIDGNKIIVRKAKSGEKINAINQKEYELAEGMCVIADASSPVAVAGVMGGLDTEISDSTVNILIETADFAPISVRNTARKLSLHSDSSFRFERGMDRTQMDWASRRCCELILQLAGGELLDEPIIAGEKEHPKADAVPIRFEQVDRLLGIHVPAESSVKILEELGLEQVGKSKKNSSEFIPPAWRRDLTREVDLIEEIARIYGYEKIPEDAFVPMSLSHKTRVDRVADKVRSYLTGIGFYETISLTFESEDSRALFQPHGDQPALYVDHSSRRHENLLRQSLVPSLLRIKRENEKQGTFHARLFEIAKVYLKAMPGESEDEVEPTMLSFVGGNSFADLKGILESLAVYFNHAATITAKPSEISQFTEGRGAEIYLNGKSWGWVGEIDRSVSDNLDLRDSAIVAEVDFNMLVALADLTPAFQELDSYPAIARDLNFLLDESVTWEKLEQAVRDSAGPLLDAVSFTDQYRGKQIESGKKSYVISVSYRSSDRTLTGEEVDEAQKQVIKSCSEKLDAVLR